MMSTHKTIFFAIFIAISLFQCTSSLNFAGPPWFVFARQDITGVPPQPPPHSISKNIVKTAVFPVLSLVAAQNSEEKKPFKEEMKQTVVKEVHLVVSRSTYYYSENQIFCFLKSQRLTCCIFF